MRIVRTCTTVIPNPIAPMVAKVGARSRCKNSALVHETGGLHSSEGVGWNKLQYLPLSCAVGTYIPVPTGREELGQ